MSKSAFSRYVTRNYPHRFNVAIEVGTIAGGIPSDPKVAEGWIRAKMTGDDYEIQKMVFETMSERAIEMPEAAAIVANLRQLNGFMRDAKGVLYIPGRYLKACLKEAGNVAQNEGRLPDKFGGPGVNGSYKKGWKSWAPEHIFVVEDRLSLGVTAPTGIAQRFVHTFRGSAIQYEEYVEEATFTATVETDHDFTKAEWAAIWLTAERNGIGASRSQGFGTFTVTSWEPA